MSTLKERMEELAQVTGWDVGRIADIAGLSSSAVSQWFGKGSKTINSIARVDAATKLAKESGYSAVWLARGEGPKRLPNGPQDVLIAKEPELNQFIQPRHDAYTLEAIAILSKLDKSDRRGAVAALRTYVQNLGPPRVGHNSRVAA